MSAMWKYILLVIVALAGLLVVLIRPNASPVSAEAPSVAADLAPAWELRDVEGKPVSSAQFRGKVVILDFWATWCPPCQAEIPGFVDLQKTYGEKGLVIVGVSLDRTGPAAVKEFMQRFHMNYPVVMGDRTIVEAFGGIEGLPTAFIIDREGRLVKMHVGYAASQVFEDEIKPLL